MSRFLFCNIGWMDRYEGQKGKPDRIVGGGAFVKMNKRGQEVCNFKPIGDRIFGHVETIKGKLDRQIRIENLGATRNDFVNGVDVIWTATNPEEGGRRVVGWYLDATVFRERQSFESPPSKQHEADEIGSYRITAKAVDAAVLDIHDRHLTLTRAKGWMGHTPWWVPNPTEYPEVKRFLRKVERQIGSGEGSRPVLSKQPKGRRGSPATTDPYVRYVQQYEVVISPRHYQLEKEFQSFLNKMGLSDFQANRSGVDLAYSDHRLGQVLVEIKPADDTNSRFAIRTAIGQLLDYRQTRPSTGAMLIILGCKPNNYDQQLALLNGIGIGYPHKDGFEISWPQSLQ